MIGAEEVLVRDVMMDIYHPVFAQPAQILCTSRRTAELIKYAANAFLATKIAFINEVANLCERVGADVTDIARGIGLDKRIQPMKSPVSNPGSTSKLTATRLPEKRNEQRQSPSR